jgi:hypothetical protein
MTIKHLQSDTINCIALSLDEDVYGSNGDLDEFQIRDHLIENIHAATGYQYGDTIPVHVVANLIQSVWEYEDRKYMDEISERSNCPTCRANALAK